MTRSAREDFALAEELIGDTVVRLEVGESTTLTHAQAVARVADRWQMFERTQSSAARRSPA